MLLSGKTVELANCYAGGASRREPQDVDPGDGTVSYTLNADNIDEFLTYDKA